MIKEPRYDNELVPLGYLKKYIGGELKEVETVYSKNFGSQPSPPYYVNNTYMTDGHIFKCIKNRLNGTFKASDWELIATDDASINNFIENTYSTDKLLLQEQIDGKIETFYQDNDPSIEWITDLLKAKHKGDYWYNTTNNTQWRYNKSNTNPITYSWGEVNVPTTVYSLINGKKSIYTTKPIAYQKNDMWIIENDISATDLPNNVEIGDWVFATQSSTSYNKSHWLKRDTDVKKEYLEEHYYNTTTIDNKFTESEDSTTAKINRAVDEIELEVNQTYTKKSETQAIVNDYNQQIGTINTALITQGENISNLSVETGRISSNVSSVETIIQEMITFEVELSIYSFNISCDTDNKPFESKIYSINTKGFYGGIEVEEYDISINGPNNGINTNINNKTIEFSTLNTVAIMNPSNEYLISFSFLIDEETYNVVKKVVITRVNKGEKGLQGETGPRGLQGLQGIPGADGQNSYFHIKYSNVASPTSSQMNDTGGSYIGTYVDNTELDSTNPTDYTWVLVKGAQGDIGAQGIAGTNGTNGQTSYLHIAYSTSATGNTGFSVSDSINKTYIGQYTDFILADSTDPTKYKWTKIKGETGAQGPAGQAGANGITYYTWIKYADTPTTGISDNPTGKSYIGIAYNKTTQTESNTYSDYIWSLIKGETGAQGPIGQTGPTGPTGEPGPSGEDGANGVSITSIVNYFAVNTSTTTAPTSGWSTTRPTRSAGQYLWVRELITFSNGTTTNTTAYIVTGDKGDTGATGLQGLQGPQGIQGIQGPSGEDGISSYFHIKYSVNANGNPMTETPSTYIGTRVDSNPNDSTNYLDYTWVRLQGAQGVKGDQGIAGVNGINGQTSYLHIAYATNDTGTAGFSVSDSVNKTYIGQCTDFSSTDPTTPSSYSWSKIKGETGATGATGPTGPQGPQGQQGERGLQGIQGERGLQGIQGPTGANGQTSYFHIKYSANANGNPMSETPNKYIGTYVDFNSADSNTYTDYTWTQFQGSQGATGSQGIPGTNGVNGQTSYLHIAYATSADGSTGFSVSDSTDKTYIGQCTNFTSADPTTPSSYSWTKIKGEQGEGTEVILGTQTSSTYAWTGVATFDELTHGKQIAYMLPFAGTGTSATLNLTLSDGTTTGAKNLYYKGTSRITTHFSVGSVIHLTYLENVRINGSSALYTGWWADGSYDSGNTYDRVRFSNSIKFKTATTGYCLIVGDESGFFKLQPSVPFDVSAPILFLAQTSTIAANSTSTNGYLAYPSVSLRYNVANITLTQYKTCYLVGNLIGKVFTPDATNMFTTTIPTTDDGKYYISLGYMTSTYQIYLYTEHPIFKYSNGSFNLLPGATGPQGLQGIQGPAGSNGTSSYFHVRYSVNSNGNPMTTTPSSTSQYLGVAVTNSATAPTGYASYTWTKIKGADGANGSPGASGSSSYLHLKYSDDGLTFTPADTDYALGERPSAYVGQYIDSNVADSTTFSDYTWYKFTEDIDQTLVNISETINSNKNNIEADLSNKYNELNNKFDDYATNTSVTSRLESVTTNLTSTQLEVNVVKETLLNGVPKVRTEKGFTFDDEGMTVDETNSPTKTNVDTEGVLVIDKTSANNQELLFAGYDNELRESIVRSMNMLIQKYFSIGNTNRARMEMVTDPVHGVGIGIFIMRGDS